MNIGNQDEMTMLQLAQEIIELAGSRSKIVFRELPEDDPKIRQPDTSRARTTLNWHARIDREEGLKRTIEYFRSQMK
jgi:dTDP-glucose 4,6-dehydratase